MSKNHQWKEYVTLIAGSWLASSPWALSHAEQMGRMLYNAVGAGLATALLSLVALFWIPERQEPPIMKLALGLWTMGSPWLLGFAAERDMMLSTVVTGAVVAIVSLLQLSDHYGFTDRSLQ